jgi:hypothetical protein
MKAGWQLKLWDDVYFAVDSERRLARKSEQTMFVDISVKAGAARSIMKPKND